MLTASLKDTAPKSEIRFIYWSPGHKLTVVFERGADVVRHAQAISDAGFKFQAVELADGRVRLVIADEHDEVASEVCDVGSEPSAAVDCLILNFPIAGNPAGEAAGRRVAPQPCQPAAEPLPEERV